MDKNDLKMSKNEPKSRKKRKMQNKNYYIVMLYLRTIETHFYSGKKFQKKKKISTK